MKSTFLLFALVFVLLASATPQQTQPPERVLAVQVLRILNTAEVNFAASTSEKHFGTFDDLRPVLTSWKNSSRSGTWGDALNSLDLQGSDPLPGWDLRVVPSADGRHYSLAVKNKQYCDMNGFSDDTGVIYLGSSIGCDRKLPQ